MSEHKQAISDALTQALADVGGTDSPVIEHVRHPVRQSVPDGPRPPALRTREGRYHPETLVCIFCNVPKHEHGKVCGRDDYTEWQRHLLEACREGSDTRRTRIVESFTEWRQRTMSEHGNEQSAHKLRQLYEADAR